MNKKDIEKLLKSQAEIVVPDIYDKIKDNLPDKTITKPKKTFTINLFKPLMAAAAAIILFIAAGVFSNSYFNAPMSIVYIDINPSIALTVSRNYKVTAISETENLTEGGKGIIGLNIEEAALKIIDIAITKGYIKTNLQDGIKNAISISTNINDNNGGRIIQNINAKATNLLKERNIIFEIIEERFNENDRTEAQQSGISPGKMLLIRKIIALDSGYKINDLIELNIRELNTILKELEKQKDENSQTGAGGNRDNNNGTGGNPNDNNSGGNTPVNNNGLGGNPFDSNSG